MSDVAIQVENLGKRFFLAQPYNRGTLREQLGTVASLPLRLFKKKEQGEEPANAFWALKDISFDIKAGEVIGLIGANGSGKSTLLRILTRISAPTTGRFRLYGRLGSLLDIGTGFHPDLSGRENVYLNGSILGMRRSEITRKFDEIVAFAEVEKFIDTQVKFYSSGMYVRLAFSVACHLDADVLLLDEVLGVGDYGFQQKSSQKLMSLVKDGRTVVLVSHQMAQVEQLCTRILWLHYGTLLANGSPAEIIPTYLESFTRTEEGK